MLHCSGGLSHLVPKRKNDAHRAPLQLRSWLRTARLWRCQCRSRRCQKRRNRRCCNRLGWADRFERTQDPRCLARPKAIAILRQNCFADAARVLVLIFRFQQMHLRIKRQRSVKTFRITRGDPLVHRQCLIGFPHRLEIGGHRHSRAGCKLVIWILIDENLKSRVGFDELLFVALRFREQEISCRASRRVWITGDHLLIIRRALCAAEQSRCSRIPPIGIKTITGKTDDRQQCDHDYGSDLVLESYPEDACFQCCISGRWWSRRHNSIVDVAPGGFRTARASSYATRNFPAQARGKTGDACANDF